MRHCLARQVVHAVGVASESEFDVVGAVTLCKIRECGAHVQLRPRMVIGNCLAREDIAASGGEGERKLYIFNAIAHCEIGECSAHLRLGAGFRAQAENRMAALPLWQI
jgi:hypothetical protein